MAKPPTPKSVKPWLSGVKGTQVLPLINLDDKAMRVEAGPGTGKTYGLARRVVRIMHKDGLNVPGKQILIVAFNRVIAKQLREDILGELSKCEFSAKNIPVIRTVHALCLEAIGEEIRLLLPHEKEAMLYDVLNEHPTLAESYSRHRDADQALRDHEAKHETHDDLWKAVVQWLTRHNARLISDLPGMLLDRIKGGDFTDRKYNHVIVDEFQDLTPGEQQLFVKLRAKGGFFVALGDSRQSIYAFRGNDREGLSKLDGLLAPTPVKDHGMTECRRCPADVVQAANKLMGLSDAEKMVPGSATAAKIGVLYWNTPSAEAEGMARIITDNIKEHPEQKHLVMVTRKRFGFMLRDQIANLDAALPVDLSFSESLLEVWPVREAFLLFCLLTAPDAPTWRAWLGYQNCPDAETSLAPERNSDAYLKFLTKCDDCITSELVEELSKELRTTNRGKGGAKLWDRAERFVKLRDHFQFTGGDVAEYIETVFDPDFWTGTDDTAATTKLDLGLLRQAALIIASEHGEEDEPEDVLRKVADQLRYQIATRETGTTSDAAASLQVTTLWGAKGITADHVYILGLCEPALPGTKREEYPGTTLAYQEEQRRLFYVSITRPKETLILSRAKKIREGEAKQLGLDVIAAKGWATLKMCPFLRDIMAHLPDAQSGDEWSW